MFDTEKNIFVLPVTIKSEEDGSVTFNGRIFIVSIWTKVLKDLELSQQREI